MPEHPVSMQPPSREIHKDGAVVGITDIIYSVEEGTVIFEDVLVKGDLSGEIEYNGRMLVIERVHTTIGMEVSMSGPRGPVWKGVECRILR